MRHIVLLLLTCVLTACLSISGLCGTSNITPEDLLAATLSKADISTIFSDPDHWWPQIPEFYGDAFKDNVGEEFYVVQSFGRTDPGDKRKVETALTLYENDSAAKAGYAAMADTYDKDGTKVDGPAVANECRYYTRTSENHPFECVLRFRVGSIIGRVGTYGGSGYDDPAILAKCAQPMVRRIHWLLDGKLRAKPVSPDTLGLLPPASVEKAIGTVFGTAMVPLECWAMADSSNDPAGVRERLNSAGLASFVVRRYGIAKDPKQIVETDLFAFPDENSAAQWARYMLSDIGKHKLLHPGATGHLSGFTYRKNISLYELTFAKGRFVADVSAWAPYDETSPICEDAARKLAEIWYASLPAE